MFQPSGVLVVDKPSGISSFDVIRRVRRLSGQRKLGHAGTLDPMASGVLLVMMNKATRLTPYLTDGRKRYRAEVLLGVQTDSDDAMGEVTNQADLPPQLSREQLVDALTAFVGRVQQVPPQVSALHVDGVRAYKLARRGEEFEMPAREVEIESIDVLNVALPKVELDVRCGKGTYIRSIARDLGRALGTFGHLSALRRTQVGPFDLSLATSLEQLEALGMNGLFEHLVPPYEALSDLLPLDLDAEACRRVSMGQNLFLGPLPQGVYRVADAENEKELVAIVLSDGVTVQTKVFTAI
ncbi:MAG: tRNA pseudouridine(55) synthase TruB [Deltaproteobacteria bacterium CG_4_9_14_3_um_filter_63_12]|nr:MAG: tRNA pseudouridine(55) synthase TruB [Deltaproteobacteria bacterium CG_4_9_14_3_um_filter_63_12]